MNLLDLTITKLILIIYFVAFASTIIHIIKTKMSNRMKVLWTLIIVVVPLIGSFLYAINQMFLIDNQIDSNINYNNDIV